MRPRVYTVRRVLRETADVFTIDIAPEDRGGAGTFRPGQFNMLYAVGVGEVPVSIADGDGERITHTIRAVGPVTRAMAQWKRGTALGVRGPFGSAWPLAEAEGKDVVIVAGGLGLAPLWGAVQHVLRNRKAFANVAILYGARSPLDLLYRGPLERLAARTDVHFAVTVDRPLPSWSGNVGVVTAPLARAQFDPSRTVAMICGPEIMMRFSVRVLVERGLAESSIHLSLERNMKCAVALCGHCQFGPEFICKDGPVFRHDRVARWLSIPEL